MFSFSMVLLEEGVEMELPIGMSELISILDGLVPSFTCAGHEYQLGVVFIDKYGREPYEYIFKAQVCLYSMVRVPDPLIIYLNI